MEYLNKVEIKGVIGRVNVKQIGDRLCANFSVVTDYVYTSKDGSATVESTWFSVTAWNNDSQGKRIVDLNELKKGDGVHVVGRQRMRSYTDEKGETKSMYEIIASKVEIVPRD